jgi:hypothetical protein
MIHFVIQVHIMRRTLIVQNWIHKKPSFGGILCIDHKESNISCAFEVAVKVGLAGFEPTTIKQLVPVLFRRHLGKVITKTTRKVVFSSGGAI